MRTGKWKLHAIMAGWLAVAMLLVPSAVPAGESRLQEIIKAKVIRIGMSGDYPPFCGTDPKTGEFVGMDVELAQKLAAALGAKIVYVRYKWPELTRDLLEDKFDIAMGGVGRNLARGQVLAYTNSYLKFGTCPLVRKGDEGKYKDLASIDQPGVKLILNQGGLNDRYFTPLMKKATILRHNKNDEIAMRVRDGAADVWITDNVEALYWAKQIPSLTAVNPDKVFTVGTKGYMIRQGDQVFLNWLNLWLDQMFLEGHVQKLQEKWLGRVLE